MSQTPPSPALDTLLAHRGWVRSLARKLVFDPGRADDLEQQTWLAAITSPPQTLDRPRSWLASVMKRQLAMHWRGETRRTARERSAARPEAVPATDDVVAQTESHRMLVEAVLALDEPYRTTVLLRHFDGLAPREVAARMGAPIETVRSRLKRANAQLRERLDGDHRGDRRAWCLALLPLCREDDPTAAEVATSTTATTGALLMTTKTKFGLIAAAVCAALLIAHWALQDDAAPETGTRTADAVPAPDEDTRSPRVRRKADDDPEPAAEPEPTAAPEEDADPTGPGFLVVSAGDPGSPVGAASVRIHPEDGAATSVTTDARGFVGMPAGLAGRLVVWASAPGFATQRFTAVAPGEVPTRLVLHPGRPVRFAFVRPDGSALPADEAKARYERTGTELVAFVLWDEFLAGGDTSSFLRTVLGSQDAWTTSGALEWRGDGLGLGSRLAPGRWRVLLWTPDGHSFVSDPVEGEGADLAEISVPVADAPALTRVRLVDAETGVPLAGARAQPYFEYGDDQAFVPGPARVADGNGLVTIPGRPKLAAKTRPMARRADAWWFTSATHAAFRQNNAVVTPEAGDVVDVAIPRSAVIEGEAYDRAGAPATGHMIQYARKGRRIEAPVGEDGTFRIAGIPGKSTRGETIWLVEDIDSMQVVLERVQVKPGETSRVVIGRKADPANSATVEGRITIAGRPVEGAAVNVRNRKAGGKGSFGLTDAEGRFSFPNLPLGETDVRILLGDPRCSDDYGMRSTKPLTLGGGDRSTLDFDLPAGRLVVRLVDADTDDPIARAIVAGGPEDRAAGAEFFPGFRTTLGWSGFTQDDGTFILRGLPPGESLRIYAGGTGYAIDQSAGHIPAVGEQPPEVTIKLKRK